MDEKKMPFGSHSLSLEGRSHLTVTEVKDVGSFNEEAILVNLFAGELAVKGQNLHIQKLDLESSKVEISGLVQSLSYSEKKEAAEGGFLRKLFK
ncbi:MAG: sporulation protein YabP [Firmicutes bacterium]|nr:sporulation protein YabP [Clostridiales bacterium]MBQ9930822.1 sporulation protein YabP [Bacillota bacterium]